jgi:hypothetical protein
VKCRNTVIRLRLETLEDEMQFLYFFNGGLKLVDEVLRQVPVVLVVVSVIFDSVLCLPSLTLVLHVVQDSLCLPREICELLAYLDKDVVLAFDTVQKSTVVVFSHEDPFKLLNGISLRVLDAQMIL